MALLAGLQHERATDPRIGELLSIAENSDLVAEASQPTTVNVRELRRRYDRQIRLPRVLVEDLAHTTSLAQSVWVSARAANDFAAFRPWLEKIIHLKRRESACQQTEAEFGIDAAPGRKQPCGENATFAPSTGSPYDPLLDEYEPQITTAELNQLFRALRTELVPLVAEWTEAARASAGGRGAPGLSTTAAAASILNRRYPSDRQKIFGETVAAAVGFNFERGRLDVAAHPFCTGIGPGDCRITTRYDDHNFSDAFFGVLHEVGHGLYEQGLDRDAWGTPMGDSVSLGVHESQSRLWENAVGRGRAFWTHWFPIAKSVFRESLADVSLDQFHRAVNHVTPSLIRVQADEATYNLHIIVRFELEQALISGDLAVADLPSAWNEKYQSTLGVTPQSDAEGCLQDIHWSAGLVGYFPTYTLGNVYAAQLYAKADADLGGLDAQFARGEYRGLLEWLRDKVHGQGQRFRPAELIEHVTGSKPDHRPLIASLRRKYAELHGA